MEISPALLPRIAQAEAAAHRRYGTGRAGQVSDFGPVVAVSAGAGSPLSSAWCDGTRPPTPAEIQEYLDWTRERGDRPCIQALSDMAPALLPLLDAAGLQVQGVLHVYAHNLQRLGQMAPPGVQRLSDAAQWASSSAQGFGEGSEEVMQLVAQAPDTELFAAVIGGQVAGTGALSISHGVAALYGASTRPEFRRLGAQQALLNARLHFAAQQGADFATVFVTPQSDGGSPSERNIRRAGCQLVGMRLTFGPVR